MKTFKYVEPQTLSEAVTLLNKYGHKAKILAGGTDLLGQMKNRIFTSYPEIVINIKSISGLEDIREDDQGVKIGALAPLANVASNPILNEKYRALTQSAGAVASPQIRHMGTIGGNLCQDIRCWYYRAPKNYFPCLRKVGAPKGALCYAVKGDNRYHSIFGPVKRCFAVNPSDVAPTLIALGATLITTSREIDAGDFFGVKPERTTVLGADEILTTIQIPHFEKGTNSQFLKFALRKTIDFPIANCAVKIRTENGLIKSARVCLNGVYNIPYRAFEAESFLIDRTLNEEIAIEAAQQALSKTKTLSSNAYIVPIAKDLVRKAVLACARS